MEANCEELIACSLTYRRDQIERIVRYYIFQPLSVHLFIAVIDIFLQQEDLIALGKLILALSCYSIESIQREMIQQSLEFVARKYSNDLKTLIL